MSVKKAPAKKPRPSRKPAPKKPVANTVATTTIPWNAIAIAVVGLAFVWFQYRQTKVSPNPSPDVPTVANAISEVVAKVENKDAVKAMGRLYLALGDVLGRSKSMSSSQLRAILVSADLHHLQGTDIKVPGFGAAKDAEFAKLLGMEDKELTAAELTAVVKLCKEIALACGVTDAN